MMSYFYALKIQYIGTSYKGWQIQTDDPRTIQGQLNFALEKITKNKVHTIGSGRTDKGVHARGQVVRAEVKIKIEPSSLLKALNSNTPDDIQVLSALEVTDDFNPVFDAVSKTYKYYFSFGKNIPFFDSPYVTFFKGEVDIKKVKKALELFVGEHEFFNYYCVGTPVKSYRRTIFSAVLKTQKMSKLDDENEVYCIEVTGSGFLKQMVRLIVGAVVAVGKDKANFDDIKASLEKRLDLKVGPTAPAKGLFLESVKYQDFSL